MARVSVGDRVSEVWQQVFFKLMEIASKGRVYCHPDVRDTVMAALGPEGVGAALGETIKLYVYCEAATGIFPLARLGLV